MPRHLVWSLAVLAVAAFMAGLMGCAAAPRPAQPPAHPWAYCSDFNAFCASPPKPV